MSAIYDLEKLILLDKFMDPEGADPDLSLLPFLSPVEMDPIKFDIVFQDIRISTIRATDFHRNVEIPALCTSLDACIEWVEDYPYFTQLLVDGGPAVLGDGARMDSYHRGLRWGSNHTLVSGNDAVAIREAVGTGRSFGAFDALDMSDGFDFFAYADGEVVEMGREIVSADAVVLYVRAPTLSVPPWGIDGVTDCSTAEITTKVIRATADGSEVVDSFTGQGITREVPASEGVWRIEVWIRPRHLVPALKGIEQMADADYPYIYSNAIVVR